MGSKRVGYTSGVFDLFHIGHLNILTRAREQCDHLIVAVTTDELALETKGRFPVIPYEERAEIVASLRVVDEVIPQRTMKKIDVLDSHPFDVIFVGDDHRGTERWNQYEIEFEARSIDVVYFPYTTHTSSTRLSRALDDLNQLSRMRGVTDEASRLSQSSPSLVKDA